MLSAGPEQLLEFSHFALYTTFWRRFGGSDMGGDRRCFFGVMKCVQSGRAFSFLAYFRKLIS
jgi:hypothetical protein